MAIYLFRAGSSQTFAYSLDVTGRNIPPMAEDSEWRYERTVDTGQLEKAHPEALRPLQANGFYLFTASRAAAARRAC
jgi:hypothetical protein